jgi:hypothetical protein
MAHPAAPAFDIARFTAPFRMQPGLQRLGAEARQLTPLLAGSALWRDKERVFASGQSRLAVPGFDAEPALQAIAAQAAAEGHVFDGPVELAFEEDFAVLDGATSTLPWLCVSVPSHWAPEEKLGLPFAAVHAPVADNALLLAASHQLVNLVTSGDRFERFVWTVTPSGRHDQHPHRQPRTPWPETTDAAEFAAACFLRHERQTFFPVPGTRQSIFTIRVMLQPLTEVIAKQDAARRMHDSLASMSDAVLAYKNLAPARDLLLAWLAGKAA